MRVHSCVFLIFTTRVDQTNGSTLVKLILFEKSRVDLEFVFSIFTTRVRKHRDLGNSARFSGSRAPLVESRPNHDTWKHFGLAPTQVLNSVISVLLCQDRDLGRV